MSLIWDAKGDKFHQEEAVGHCCAGFGLLVVGVIIVYVVYHFSQGLLSIFR